MRCFITPACPGVYQIIINDANETYLIFQDLLTLPILFKAIYIPSWVFE